MLEFFRWSHDRAQLVVDTQARAFLIDRGVPTSIVLFEATENPSDPFVTVDGVRVVEVGAFSDDFRFYLAIDRGQVFFGLEGDDTPVFVNESLEDFVACLLLFEEGCPFYAPEDGTEVKEVAGRDLAARLAAVDPLCLTPGESFWNSIVHDVSIGDYAEGDV